MRRVLPKTIICDSETIEEAVGYGFDATMVIETMFSGSLESTAEMTGQTELDVTCDGSSCEYLAYVGLSFPCPMVIDINIELE